MDSVSNEVRDDPRFFADLPESLQMQLPMGESVIYCIASDMNAQGRFGDSYLVITELFAGNLSETDDPIWFPLNAIEEAITDELLGAGRLLIKQADSTSFLIHYSRNFVPEFTAVARIIEDLAQGKTVILPEMDGAAFSEEGTPLSHRSSVSPTDISRWQSIKRLLHYVRPHAWVAVAFAIATLATSLASVSMPLITKYIIDGAFNNGDLKSLDLEKSTHQLGLFCLLMVGIAVVSMLAKIVEEISASWLANKLVTSLREDLHEHIQKLTMSYHNNRESGELISRIMNDTADLRHFIRQGLPFLLVNVPMFFFIGALLIWLNPWLSLCVFVPVPFLIFGGRFFWKLLVPLFHKIGNRRSVLHSNIVESVKGIRAIKASGQEERRHGVFKGRNQSMFDIEFRLERASTTFFQSMTLLMGLGAAGVWYFGGKAILDPASTFTFGGLVAFIGYIAMFYAPLQWATAVFNWFTNAMAASDRIFQVLDHKAENYEDPEANPLPEVEGRITFDDVRFSYNRGKEIIKGISFTAEPGEMIGLVGRSGAGKTTMINLICRFYDVDSGAIKIDGHRLQDVHLKDWRSHIGIVMQDPFVFSGSITENICYGHPEADFDDVVRAARAAKAHDFILDKEEGYDTVIGEAGIDLSGGERQRIAIARAILDDPRILILDEATSAIDSQTEKAIQEAIANLVKGRTTIAIAHRLATLRNADRLVVIENGKIVEQGSHEELLANDEGHFAKLVRIQAENNQLRGGQIAYSQDG